MIYTSYPPLTHHLWLISRIRTRFRQYSRIDYFGNLWRYHGFTDFDARYRWVFHYDDIQELVIFDDDWHLNIFLILPILSISSFFSVAHDMMISIIFLQLMMWPYSALGLIILLLMTSTINPFMTISSYSAFLCSLTISRIFRFISFPPIYLDFVHFRRFRW